MTDPLPVMTVELNGTPVTVFLDTGGDVFILDDELAAEFGIDAVATAKGTFGGGRQADLGLGKVDALRIGTVTLENVPIMTLATKRFSPLFADGERPIGGIITTGVLRQFLATVDYEQAQLLLRERSDKGRAQLTGFLDGKRIVEVPFALDATHLMMARGGLDDRDGLTFFVDSGLASEAAFAAPLQTLQLAGIPVPETHVPEDGVGGGGGVWASGEFAIARLALGHLVQTDLKGEYGSRTPKTYWERGFIQDGLISHRFLRQYSSWTIDFDRMRYVFAE